MAGRLATYRLLVKAAFTRYNSGARALYRFSHDAVPVIQVPIESISYASVLQSPISCVGVLQSMHSCVSVLDIARAQVSCNTVCTLDKKSARHGACGLQHAMHPIPLQPGQDTR